MDGITLQIKGEDEPRIFDRQDIRFFTPEELFDMEIDNNVLYINSNMVEWAREATPHECREVGGYNAWEAAEDAPESDAHSTPFLIFFGLTCALIGAIAYKWAVILL